MTALTVYYTNTASSTLSTANQLYTTSGSPSTNQKLTLIDNLTGYGELYSQGNASTWAAAGSIGAPSGHGFLYDVTTLQGQTIAAGNWSAAIRLNSNSGANVTASIFVRAYKYNAGVYTLIVSMTLATQSFTGTIVTYSLPATSASAVSFTTGDKLYIDAWLNITSNSSAVGNSIKFNRLSTDTVGSTGDPTAEVVTPGYAPTVTTSTRTVTATAALLATKTRTVPTTAALLATKTRTVTESAALLSTKTRTVSATAALATTSTRTVPETAALLRTSQRTVSASAALIQTKSRTVTETVALQKTTTRTVPATVALAATKTRTVPATTALKALGRSRTVTAMASLLATKSRTVSSTAALKATSARTVNASAALAQTRTRTVPTTATLTAPRIVPCAAALLAKSTRTVPGAAALAPPPPVSNAIVTMRSGAAIATIRSGNVVVYLRK